MTDYFALFQVARQPWLELDSLKANFIALSAEVHPDRVHDAPAEIRQAAHERYAELNVAYNHLRDPKERLLHLLELELGRKPQKIQRVPAEIMDLFMEVGQLCREVDGFLAEKNKVTSPLLKVQFFERAMELTDKLMRLQQTVNAKRLDLEAKLKEMNVAWEKAGESATRGASLPLDQLEEISRLFSYSVRWSGEIQERIVKLSF